MLFHRFWYVVHSISNAHSSFHQVVHLIPMLTLHFVSGNFPHSSSGELPKDSSVVLQKGQRSSALSALMDANTQPLHTDSFRSMVCKLIYHVQLGEGWNKWDNPRMVGAWWIVSHHTIQLFDLCNLSYVQIYETFGNPYRNTWLIYTLHMPWGHPRPCHTRHTYAYNIIFFAFAHFTACIACITSLAEGYTWCADTIVSPHHGAAPATNPSVP